MRHVYFSHLLNHIEAMAKADATPNVTGWASLHGAIRCAYYPRSRRHRWFLKDGPTSERDLIAWLGERLK